MAIITFGRRRPVKQHGSTSDNPSKQVATGTRYLLMGALQGERRPGVVTKVCRLPAIDTVTTGAIRHVPAARKLRRMRIVVAA